MDREFLDHYNRELELLYEHAVEFAEEYPGIAGRLGGILRDRTDPMVAGLLEGTAFLAARVQLKLKHEFPEFTNNLLEQLVPNYLAPVPSVMLAAIAPPFGDPALRDGRTIPRGSALDAIYLEHDRRIACRFVTTREVTLWPFAIQGAEYLPTAGATSAAGVPTGHGVIAGVRLTLTHRTTGRLDDEISSNKHDVLFSGCRTTELPIHFIGPEPEADALCEQLLGHCTGVWFRYPDSFGNPVVIHAPAECITHIGFEEKETLLPADLRVFRGYDLLHEHFVFPRKFLGIRLRGLEKNFAKVTGEND